MLGFTYIFHDNTINSHNQNTIKILRGNLRFWIQHSPSAHLSHTITLSSSLLPSLPQPNSSPSLSTFIYIYLVCTTLTVCWQCCWVQWVYLNLQEFHHRCLNSYTINKALSFVHETSLDECLVLWLFSSIVPYLYVLILISLKLMSLRLEWWLYIFWRFHLIHWLIHWLIYLLIHWLVHLLIHWVKLWLVYVGWRIWWTNTQKIFI